MTKIPTTGYGKGSAPRKNNDQKTYEDNWEKIFGKKNQKVKQKQLTELNWDGEEYDPADTTWEDLADD
jgi:hypothetical protein